MTLTDGFSFKIKAPTDLTKAEEVHSKNQLQNKINSNNPTADFEEVLFFLCAVFLFYFYFFLHKSKGLLFDLTVGILKFLDFSSESKV